MKAVGIVAEYNPFHMGHAFQIAEAKRLSGLDRAVVIMSASFVQRGEPACADKFLRAKWAVRNGADIVIELPDVFSVSCAERFASGALRILKGTGLVSALSFGSESGDLEALKNEALGQFNEDIFISKIKTGVSYPKAAAEASGSSLAPNDLLGAEYISANEKYGCGFDIIPVKRDNAHDAEGLGGEFSSAYAIRSIIRDCSTLMKMSPAAFDGLSRALPRDVLLDISDELKEGALPSTLEGLSDAVIYRFRSMTLSEISSLPEISEGLENLFSRYAEECNTVSEMLSRVKSKRYTMARLKRTVVCAMLGITRKLQDRAASDDSALYARVLAVRGGSNELLSELKEKSNIPVIVQAADRNILPALADEIERISRLAHSVRALGQPYKKVSGADPSHKLIIE